jgi:phospholipid/cholesterol/gamma-HCH transport system substrate-binding protein
VSAPANHWKLGAFVMGAVLVGLAAAVALMAQRLQILTVSNKSYFDEAVTGLEVGSPVSFRGVKIGNVSAIDVAPDRRHVEVTYSLGVAVLKRLGLAGTTHGLGTKMSVPPGLRVQLASTGLTGTKYLQIDFFDTGGAPPPVLPFPVPDNYIPATPSTMKNLEAAVVRAVDQFPDLARELGGAIARMNVILEDVDRRGLPGKAVATLERGDRLIATLLAKLDAIPVADLSREAAATLRGASAALAKLERVLVRLDGDDGLVASVQRTSEALSDAAGPSLGTNLDETGRDLREAAVAVRQLAEALQRDPDMLIKGKARVRR